ncbi:MAG: hypothetical protein PF505_11280 [Vallitaleaceae bacterium]|jgi:hypothetical protein|nr:hypothetical protein [Vallitaleaceae bacterium]
MSLISKSIVTLIALMLIIILGFVLSRLGRPYNQLIFNVHKIIALVLVVYSFIYIKKQLVTVEPGRIIVVVLVLILICIVALFATGAMLSIGKVSQVLLKRIHLSSTIVLVVSIVIFLVELIHKLKNT